MKTFTIELDKKGETLDIHLNKEGAEYLKGILDKLIKSDRQDHLHLMTPDWGGDELTSEKQNQSKEVELLHPLKIFYWNKLFLF